MEHPRETSQNNIIGTVALLEAAKDYGVKRFIFSSSGGSIYGNKKIIPTKESENAPNPQSPYALQKYVGEEFCTLFSSLYGLETVSLRYFNVFGPGQYGDSPYATVIAAWLESIFLKKRGYIEGNGLQSRDFCFIDNVVNANIRAMQYTKKFSGEAFNIGAGTRINLREVKRLIEKFTGKKLDLEQRPPRVGDVKDTQADVSKAKKWFGYTPSKTFEQGLKETIQWYEKKS